MGWAKGAFSDVTPGPASAFRASARLLHTVEGLLAEKRLAKTCFVFTTPSSCVPACDRPTLVASAPGPARSPALSGPVWGAACVPGGKSEGGAGQRTQRVPQKLPFSRQPWLSVWSRFIVVNRL